MRSCNSTQLNSAKRVMLNDQVSTIMDRHARISWVEMQDPWYLEPDVISTLQTPLNLDHNISSDFRSRLRNLRTLVSDRASASTHGAAV